MLYYLVFCFIFQNTVDKLIKKANLAVMVSTSSWREQFVEALSVNGGKILIKKHTNKSYALRFGHMCDILVCMFWQFSANAELKCVRLIISYAKYTFFVITAFLLFKTCLVSVRAM